MATVTGDFELTIDELRVAALLDDLGLQPLTASQAADLLEVIEDRHQRRSTILTSQLPINTWHDNLGDPTLADAICDRLLHAANRIELPGESMRKPAASSDPPSIDTPTSEASGGTR